jgi:hypothetical protein
LICVLTLISAPSNLGLRPPRPRGRYGLIHLNGHTDFRHPGDTVHAGCRDDDEHRAEAAGVLAEGLGALGRRPELTGLNTDTPGKP